MSPLVNDRRHANRTYLLALLAGVCLLAPSLAWSQDAEPKPEVITEDVEAAALAAESKPEGWMAGLNLGATGTLNHSRRVVGAVDGLTLQLGILLNGTLGWAGANHEWQNGLAIEHTQTKTPTLDSFMKSADSFDLKSMYLYRFNFAKWLGAFARGRVNTSLFPGFDVRPVETVILKQDRQGAVTRLTIPAQENIALTEAFEPLTLHFSAGAFAEPIHETALTANTKLGVGSQHLFVGDGYVLTDIADTPEVEMTQLVTTHSFGGELEFDLKGQTAENVSWSILANFFYPFVTTSDTGLEGMDLLHTELTGKLSVKLAQWLSFDYALSAKRLPFVVEDWQVTNQVLFTAGFSLL